MDALTNTELPKNPRWFKYVLFAGMLVFAFYASTHMVAAGDTWVAMACGRHFDNHGVDTVEPFSFNSHPAGPSKESLEKFPEWTHGLIRKWHPTGWINQNWLTHLIFYKLAAWFGDNGNYNYNTLVYWKFAIYFLAVFCVYATGKLLGAGDFLSAAAACFAMVVGRSFFDIRPAGYSNLLVPVYIMILALATYRNYRLIWLIIPVIVFWSNLHGGYLYAFIMLIPFIGIHLLLRLPRRWSLCLGFSGLWLVMYILSYKFISNTYYLQVQKLLGNQVFEPSLLHNKLFVIWFILVVISVILTILKNIKAGPFYAYHIGAGVIYFISLAPRFFTAETPRNLTPFFKDIYSYHLSSSQMTFLFVSFAGGLLILAMVLKKDRFIIMPVKGIYHTIAASVAGFIAMIIFNPFHLTNLTHTFEISVSKHAESWRQVNEWKPAFDWMDKTTSIPNPVGEEEAFAVMCLLTLAAVVIWLIGHFFKPRPMQKERRKQPANLPSEELKWPKIDLAIIVISLLTLYMAIRSRRFIAIAGSAAAPVIAIMMYQIWQMTITFIRKSKSTTLNYSSNLLNTISPELIINRIIQCGTVLFLIGFAFFWGAKYKRIYLDPWPTDNRYHTVFMRMTASHLKPFEVCKFINDNQIAGHVFNYWTEGGAIAFGQDPDPTSGKIPLKLFMDGRAQAAYNHDTFRLWQTIFSGSTEGRKAAQAKKKMDRLHKQKKTNTPDYKKNAKIYTASLKNAGDWIDTQLKKHDVWVALMPQTQEDSTFMQAMKQRGNWKTAYLDNTQHMLVDIDTPQGQTLINNILNGTAVFPDTFSRNLTTATLILEAQKAARYNDVYTLVKAAFEEFPYPSSTLLMNRLVGSSTFKKMVIEDFKSYLNDFDQNKDAYRDSNGFSMRLSSVDIAARTLLVLDPKEKKRYRNYLDLFKKETKSLNAACIW